MEYSYRIFKQMIVTASAYDSISCSVSISTENDTGIVSVVSAHAQIKCDMIFHSVKAEKLINLL